MGGLFSSPKISVPKLPDVPDLDSARDTVKMDARRSMRGKASTILTDFRSGFGN